MAGAPPIRPARAEDLAALTAILNHYVRESHVTFDVEPHTPAARQAWFDGFAATGPHRLLVLDGPAGPLGYAASHPLRPKPAYASSVETTVYLRPEAQGAGHGRRLYAALLAALETEPLHRAYGFVALPNPASERLHERLGFHRAGLLSEAGFKFGRYWDVAVYERALPGVQS
jgi:phosphinothricin acetyltransferase